VPLWPVPVPATTPVTTINLEAMRTGHAVDLQDPGSVETVIGIVEGVLQRIGHDQVTFGGIQADQRRIVPKRLQQSMIKAQ
jgi:hypothetical protein